MGLNCWRLPTFKAPESGDWEKCRTSTASHRWGWLFLERTRILSGIQFTRYFIQFVFVKMIQSDGSDSNVILARQTCSQHSSMAAGSKRWALAFYFPARICYMLLISQCRGEWDVGLCTFLVLSKRMQLRSADFGRILQTKTLLNQKSALRSRILFATWSTGKVHRPTSHTSVPSDIKNI